MIYTDELQKIAEHVVNECPEFSYIKTNEILIMGKFDRGGSGGAVALCNCIDLKGSKKKLKIKINNNKVKYFIEFSFPRFLSLSPIERFTTIVHELYHISPKFDGSLRKVRHGRAFENMIEKISDFYLKKFGLPDLLNKNFDKVKFAKWIKKPRYSTVKTEYNERDIRISTCNLAVYKKRFKYVYSCPHCKREFYLKKKSRGLSMYYCRDCFKGSKYGPKKSDALIFIGLRN